MIRTFASSFVLLAAFAACGGSSSSSTTASSSFPASTGDIPLSTSDTITFETSAGGNGLPGCPEANGATYSDTIVINLATRAAQRTVATVACGAQTGFGGQLPTVSVTTNASATPAQIAAIVDAVQASSVHHNAGCGEDGNLLFLTVDHGGGQKEVYDDSSGAHCPPVVATIEGTALTTMLAQSRALFAQ